MIFFVFVEFSDKIDTLKYLQDLHKSTEILCLVSTLTSSHVDVQEEGSSGSEVFSQKQEQCQRELLLQT